MDRTFELRICVDDPRGVRTARRAAAGVFVGWGLYAGLSDDVCLVVSELITNAVVHGRSDAVLRVQREMDNVRVEVFDEDTRLPVPTAPDRQSLTGRGLVLVASLATLWGAERTGTGKIVWAEFKAAERRHA